MAVWDEFEQDAPSLGLRRRALGRFPSLPEPRRLPYNRPGLACVHSHLRRRRGVSSHTVKFPA